jgi:hypothetical protein
MRDAPAAEIDESTKDGISLYYPGVRHEAIERMVLETGAYTASPKPATVFKVHRFPEEIGASEGEPTRCVIVQSTSGVFHGYPITQARFDAKMRKVVTCCPDGAVGP